jgi:hypothetical protein
MKVTKKIEKGDLHIDVKLTDEEIEKLQGIKFVVKLPGVTYNLGANSLQECKGMNISKSLFAMITSAEYAGLNISFKPMYLVGTKPAGNISIDDRQFDPLWANQSMECVTEKVVEIYDTLVKRKAEIDALCGSVEILSKQEVVTQLTEQNNVYYRNSKGQITKLD